MMNDQSLKWNGMDVCTRQTDLYSPKVSSFMGLASESMGPSSLSLTGGDSEGLLLDAVYQSSHQLGASLAPLWGKERAIMT